MRPRFPYFFRATSSLPAIYLKQVPYTMAQLVTFDSVTRTLAERLAADAAAAAALGEPAPLASQWATLIVALTGAASAALVASLASQPGDTLLSKLNQGRRALGHTHGFAHARARRSKPGAGGSGGAGSGSGAGGAGLGSALTSSDDEVELGTLTSAGGTPGGGPSSATLAAPPKDEDGMLPGSGGAGGGEDGDADNGSFGPSRSSGSAPPPAGGGIGCAPMCALAARLGPAGLMLGWDARLAHTGTIVLVQLLIYDAVKAAVGLPVSAHGGGGHGAATEEVARRMLML
jgi:hypothetical protein